MVLFPSLEVGEVTMDPADVRRSVSDGDSSSSR